MDLAQDDKDQHYASEQADEQVGGRMAWTEMSKDEIDRILDSFGTCGGRWKRTFIFGFVYSLIMKLNTCNPFSEKCFSIELCCKFIKCNFL